MVENYWFKKMTAEKSHLQSKIFRSFLNVFVAITLSNISIAQCDFVNDITGLSLTTPPSGAAANPSLYHQLFVLVNDQGAIVDTSDTPDFYSVNTGLYSIYALNFSLTESANIAPYLTIGSSWSNLSSSSICFDQSDRYSGCLISVCDEVTVLEDATIFNSASQYSNSSGQVQEYCLVCDDLVLETNNSGSFDLSLYPTATSTADCQVVAMNYSNSLGAPVLTGQLWSSISLSCSDCWDYIGRNLLIVNPLPVELLSFEGMIDEDNNRLKWVTLSESKCDYFEVQRSYNSVNFEVLGEVKCAGYSQNELHYTFIDTAPRGGIEYYRLKQIDFDGEFNYSQIIAIERNKNSTINIYPNPATSEIIITGYQIGTNFSIINQLGQIKQRGTIQSNSEALDISHLAKGIYILQIDNENIFFVKTAY